MTEKTLTQKFNDEKKLNLLNSIKIKLLQSATDCDGMCNLCNTWYCNIYENKQQEYKIN
jgi:hypothetical protein